ncbi:RNase H domain-containing protein [Trichonephila clavipes]|nr:RNase H domain-containing protein [Trichonephila clavipes]
MIRYLYHSATAALNVCGNEIANDLAHEGSHKDSTHGGYLTFSEISTRIKQDISSSWRQASVHEWYERNRPHAAMIGASNRRDELIFARLRTECSRAQRVREPPSGALLLDYQRELEV